MNKSYLLVLKTSILLIGIVIFLFFVNLTKSRVDTNILLSFKKDVSEFVTSRLSMLLKEVNKTSPASGISSYELKVDLNNNCLSLKTNSEECETTNSCSESCNTQPEEHTQCFCQSCTSCNRKQNKSTQCCGQSCTPCNQEQDKSTQCFCEEESQCKISTKADPPCVSDCTPKVQTLEEKEGLIDLTNQLGSSCCYSTESKKNNIYGYLGLRHSEGKGIGYNQGYSTFEGLFINSFMCNRVAAFLDLRFHYFNNETSAANTGIGFRYLTCDNNNAFGLNVFYDSRKVHDHPIYNQLSIGAEWLGTVDIRFQAYFPILNTKDFTKSCYKDYPGDYQMIKKEYKEAFTSIFFDVGHQMIDCPRFSLYGAVSQYYLELDNCNVAFGGRTRLKAGICNCLDIEFEATYDTFFKAVGRIVFGLHFEWGGKRIKNKINPLYKYCDHNEVVPLGNSYEYEWNW